MCVKEQVEMSGNVHKKYKRVCVCAHAHVDVLVHERLYVCVRRGQ